MAKSKCPVCVCKEFYATNPEDEYDIHEFHYMDGEVGFNLSLAEG